MLLTPRELPLLRKRLADYYETPDGLDTYKTGSQTNLTEEAAQRYVSTAVEALRGAELFHISPSMVELLAQARGGVEQAGLMDYDLPAQVGLAYLATEVPIRPSEDDSSEYSRFYAMSSEEQEEFRHVKNMMEQEWTEHLLVTWIVTEPDPEEAPNGALLLNCYQHRDAWASWARALFASESVAPGKRWVDDPEKVRRRLPEFVYDGSAAIAFGPDAAEMRIAHTDPHGGWRRRRAETFRVLCYLLRQRVAQDEAAPIDRATRRRMAREGADPAPVRLISLRGASATGGGDGSRDYVHRWIVRGHWRRQWYPSIQANRPIWITPYVKGPEDAPMLGGEKVYTASAPSVADKPVEAS